MSDIANFGISLLSLIAAIVALLAIESKAIKFVGVVLLIVAMVFAYIGLSAIFLRQIPQPVEMQTISPTDIPRQILPTLVPEYTSTASTIIEFIVDSRTHRNNTSIRLKKGQLVRIEQLNGNWRAGPKTMWQDVNADGQKLAPGDRNESFAIPDENIMKLVGGIGTGPPFACGSNCEFRSFSDGILWLGANDDDFNNNEGDITVRVSVW